MFAKSQQEESATFIFKTAKDNNYLGKVLVYVMGQSRERMRWEHRRQEMADNGSSPSHPGSLVVPGRDWRQIGGWGGGTWLWSTRGPYVPN
jgi:hypothetical protein